MVQNPPRKETQQGWRQAVMWGLAAAAVLAIVAVSVPLITDPDSDRAGMEDMTKTPAEIADDEAEQPVNVASISTRESSEFGTYLTDDFGRAVYLFKGDRRGDGEAQPVSTCYEDCAKVWPPVTSSEPPTAEGQVDGSLLATIERRDGTKQVTYDGWPLYLFAKDFGPNQTTGQDVEDFGAEWYLVTPLGEEVNAESSQ